MNGHICCTFEHSHKVPKWNNGTLDWNVVLISNLNIRHEHTLAFNLWHFWMVHFVVVCDKKQRIVTTFGNCRKKMFSTNMFLKSISCNGKCECTYWVNCKELQLFSLPNHIFLAQINDFNKPKCYHTCPNSAMCNKNKLDLHLPIPSLTGSQSHMAALLFSPHLCPIPSLQLGLLLYPP